MYSPTKEEIEKKTEEVREHWSEKDYAQRSGKGNTELKVVSTRFIKVTEDVKREMYREEIGPKKPKKKKPKKKKPIKEEQLEREQYQASAVSFGKTVCQE